MEARQDDRVSKGLNRTIIWIPIIACVSIGFGVFSTKLIQQAFRSPISSKITNTVTGRPTIEIPIDAKTPLTARKLFGLPYSGNFKEPMDISEASLVLGCRETASKKVINDRFQKLMKLNHPDLGGSQYLASKN